MNDFPYFYRWKRAPHLKGKRLRILARGALNSVLVEFEDGIKHIVSLNSIRKVVKS